MIDPSRRALRQYLLITGNYWAFTLSDGALRMLVVLHFYQLGYSPLAIALLFLFYEFFGVVTNLVGGWLGARVGLNRTMNFGLALQVLALAMLLVPPEFLSVAWVMTAQALSGIAKDLNKMSAKSAIKMLLPRHAGTRLYRWVALLTGSKNALKGAGFFLGGALLASIGFRGAVAAMAATLALIWLSSILNLQQDLGRAASKPRFSRIFAKSPAVNALSAARLFLFGARDVWFVIALPLHLASVLGWDHWRVGAFLALWVIGYGLVQALAPGFAGKASAKHADQSPQRIPDGATAFWWACALAACTAAMAVILQLGWHPAQVLIVGLTLFGILFAVNSSLHSFLILSYAAEDGVSLDVGFYYMANAMGRLLGTVLSGWLFQAFGISACLWIATLFVGFAAMISLALPKHKSG